jgi:hypothetical protein
MFFDLGAPALSRRQAVRGSLFARPFAAFFTGNGSQIGSTIGGSVWRYAPPLPSLAQTAAKQPFRF